jgi:arylsulfatase A-like enzyme
MMRTDRPNVLLVVLDSVRAANTSLHGHEHETTPFLEELAEEATVYEQARSPGTWSLPSHTSIFTGYHIVEHGVARARHELEPGHTIFEELAEDHDYATGVFSENTWITDMPVGLKDAFDTIEGARNLPFPDAVDPSNFVLSEGQGHYVEYLNHCLERDDTLKSLANGVFTKLAWDYPRLLPDRFQSSTPARVYGDLFLDWEAECEGPWAACVNFMDGHLPYLPDEEYDEWGGTKLRKLQDEMEDQVWEFNGGQRPWWQRKALEGLYDGTIRQMDAQIERIVRELEARGVLSDTLLVITSDHGEGFGEPSYVRPGARISGHGQGIHEALVHVPLLVKHPGQTTGSRIDDPATLTQFPASVRAAVDNREPQFVPDEPVVVYSDGLEEPMKERANKYCADITRFDGEASAVYDGSGTNVKKYISWRDYDAIVRIRDAKIRYRLADEENGRVVSRFDQLTDMDIRTDTDGVEEINTTTRQRLEDLGYV